MTDFPTLPSQHLAVQRHPADRSLDPAAELGAAVAASALFSARRLRLAREALGLTQTTVASMSGVTSAAISQFEKGEARPAAQTLLRLAAALRFPVQFFATGTAPSSRELHPAEGSADSGYFRSLRSISVT